MAARRSPPSCSYRSRLFLHDEDMPIQSCGVRQVWQRTLSTVTNRHSPALLQELVKLIVAAVWTHQRLISMSISCESSLPKEHPEKQAAWQIDRRRQGQPAESQRSIGTVHSPWQSWTVA